MSTKSLEVSVHCSLCGRKWSEFVETVMTARRHALEAGWQEVETKTALETRATWRCPEHHLSHDRQENHQ